jgi:hypothetical protein
LDSAESTPGSLFGLLRRQLYFPHQAQLSAEFQHWLSSEALRFRTSFLALVSRSSGGQGF